MKQNHVFFIILTIGTFLRLQILKIPPTHDEWYTFDVIMRNFLDMHIHMYQDVHVPLYFYSIKLWSTINNSFIFLRLFSILTGILGIIIFYNITKKIYNKNTTLLGTTILAISLFHIAYSGSIRMYSLLFIFCTISLHYTIKIIEMNKNNTKISVKEYRKTLYKYIISNSAIIYTHFFGIFFLLFEIVILYIYRRTIQFKKETLKAIFVQIITAIPFLFFMGVQMYRKSIGTSYADWMPKTTPHDIYRAFSAMVSNNMLTLVMFFLIICNVTILYISKKEIHKDYKHTIITAGFLITFIVPSIITLIIPIFAWRYYIISYPMFIMIVASTIDTLCSNKKYIYAGITIFILTLLLLSTIRYNQLQKEMYTEFRRCEEEIQDIVERYKYNNSVFVSYRWLNEWVPDHRPTDPAFKELNNIFSINMTHINYYNTNISHLFDNFTNIIIISPSGWKSQFITIENATNIATNTCYGYNYFIYTIDNKNNSNVIS